MFAQNFFNCNMIILKEYRLKIIIPLSLLFLNSSFFNPVFKSSYGNFSSDNLVYSVSSKKHDLSANIIYLKRDFNGFKELLAFKESRGRYLCVNKFGFIGKYQFSLGTLNMFKVRNGKKFLNDPELQEKVFLLNVQRNKWILRKDIN